MQTTNKFLSGLAFLLGACAVIWVAIGFVHTSPLALLMTVVIGAVYLFGAWELFQFRRGTAELETALGTVPAGLSQQGELEAWLGRVPAALRNSVRLRIEGERAGLPGPGLTPYLVGLLVMLGMLGTFLGMVVTLNGAVFALEKTADLQAMRSALAVPVKGLGLAFGTSVAGVATSAMLGLISALCRRERVLAGQLLDSAIATVLRPFSLARQRQQTLHALQLQSEALPQVVDKLHAMMTQMDRMHGQMSERLLGNQEGFHASVKQVYSELADSIGHSLRDSLHQSAQATGESIRPVLELAMGSISREASVMHERVAGTVQAQIDGLAARFADSAAGVSASWKAALAGHEQTNAGVVSGVDRALLSFGETFGQRSQTLVDTVGAAYAALQAEQGARDEQRQQSWALALQDAAAALTRELRESGAQTLAQQRLVSETLAASMQASAAALTQELQQSGAATLAQQRAVCDLLAETMQANAVTLTRELQESGALSVAQQRAVSATLAETLQTTAAALTRELQQSGEATLAQQRAVCELLAETMQANAATLTRELQESGLATVAQQRGISETLALTLQENAAALSRELQQSNAQTLEQQRAVCDLVATSLQQTAATLGAELRDAGTRTLDQQRLISETVSGALQENAAALTLRLQQAGDGTLAQQRELCESLAASMQASAQALTEELRRAGAESVAQQRTIAEALTSSVQAVNEAARVAAGQTLDETTRLVTAAEELMRSRIDAESRQTEQLAQRLEQLSRLLGEELGALRVAEEQRGAAAVSRLEDLQSAVTGHLATLGTALEAPITRLIETASEAPRAAAGLIAQLRNEVAGNTARDNELLEERSRILETLNHLLGGINQAAAEQRAGIETLVRDSGQTLREAAAAFSEHAAAESGKLADVTAQVSSSAVDVASLSEAFSFAVQSFNDGNEKLIANLQRIEGAMDKSMQRSDEQLAYYVAQAREIIDLSMMSQKDVLDELRDLPARAGRAKAGAEVS